MPLNAFHLDGALGPMFCLEHLPPPGVPRTFAVLCVMPFTEENNKSRRMVALQARAFAERGGSVLVPDLSGMGDSVSAFDAATWAHWLADVGIAWSYLRRTDARLHWIWGIRSGALLACQAAHRGDIDPDRILLWQPVSSGRTYLNQVLRLASTGQTLMNASVGQPQAAPRDSLVNGYPVEVGGYLVHPDLALPMESASLDACQPRCPVSWMECSTSGEIGAGSRRAIDKWRTAGVVVESTCVTGPAFWASQEIEICEALITECTAVVSTHSCVPAVDQAGLADRADAQ